MDFLTPALDIVASGPSLPLKSVACAGPVLFAWASAMLGLSPSVHSVA